MCLEVPRRWREGRCCRQLPGRGGGPGSFPRAPAAALESLRQRAPAPASLSIGAGELGTLPPASPPAFRPPSAPLFVPAAGGTPVPEPRSLCSRSVHRGRERGTSEWPSKGTSLRSAGKESADAWRGGVKAPRPEARRPSAAGDPAPTARSMARGWVRPSRVPLCARAVWTAAALLLWTPWTAGKDPACDLRASPASQPLSPGRRAGAGAPDRGAPGKAMLRARRQLGPVPSVAWGWFQ